MKFPFFQLCETFFEQNRYPNCEECDGPTNEDWLSCQKNQANLFTVTQSMCCPYNTIDHQICLCYKETNLQFIQEPFINTECLYGYFELDNERYRCPSMIYQFVYIVQYPSCQYELYISQLDQTEKLQQSYPIQLLFDGNDIKLASLQLDIQTILNDLQNYSFLLIL
ncbi:unnamed protein product [Paramecium sonneborni]|uniref:Uncharacterized protein n=1 Tax=Paramecium sonneborni TaxID=65129 RepID=A0A8S1NHR3_9CILI|nr:unnamed protein product [Paramecium sonneborni]